MRYELADDWPTLPDRWVLGQMGLMADAQDRLYVWNRSEHPMVVLDRSGHVVDAWDRDVMDALVSRDDHPAGWIGASFAGAHGGFIDDEQCLFLAVHTCHVVLKTDLSGRLLATLGEWDRPSNPAWQGDVQTWLEDPPPAAYPPFCVPTDVARAGDGSLFVTDGYGNSRVHRFSPAGELLASFGQPGKEGGGIFHLPHGVWVDRHDRVLVADRLNHRIQLFSLEGVFLEEWTDVLAPTDLFVDADGLVYVSEAHQRRLCSVLDSSGSVIARLRDDREVPGAHPGSSSGLRSPGGHALWVDSEGSIYLNQNVAGRRLVKYRRL
jgi:hypothetical protein